MSELEDQARDAVHRRFIIEQAQRTQKVIEELCELKNIVDLPQDCLSVLSAANYIGGSHKQRREDAKWHISYYSDNDKKRIESVMNATGCSKYELYPSIDECIRRFYM